MEASAFAKQIAAHPGTAHDEAFRSFSAEIPQEDRDRRGRRSRLQRKEQTDGSQDTLILRCGRCPGSRPTGRSSFAMATCLNGGASGLSSTRF